MNKLDKAWHHLLQADETLSFVVEAIGPCAGKLDINRPIFDSIAGAIIGQQISTVAASSIRKRLLDDCKMARPFDAAQVVQVSPDQMRAAGLSRPKASYINAVARAMHTGEFDVQALASLDNDEARASLLTLKGVGPWTAEMILMFSLGRLDVFATGDVGLQQAIHLLYGYPRDDLSVEVMEKVAEPWRPYRTVAAWYLWQFLDAAPIE